MFDLDADPQAIADAFASDPLIAPRLKVAPGLRLVSGQAPFDRWIEGDEQAIDPAAKRGFVTFNMSHTSNRMNAGNFHRFVNGGCAYI